MKEVIKPKNVFDPEKLDSGGQPWSQSIKATSPFLFVSGQTAVDLEGKIQWKGNIAKQTDLALENLKKVIQAAGLDMENIVQLMWFVTSAEKFYSEGASALRRKYFTKDYPTSTLVQIQRLANPEAMVEVQAIAAYD